MLRSVDHVDAMDTIGGGDAAVQASLTDFTRAGAIRTDFTTSFQVEETEHAHGSFATVHRVSPKGWVRDSSQYPTEGLVAKFFHPPSSERMTNKPDQIMKEVSMLAMFQGHPNIVGMHGLFYCNSQGAEWPNSSRYAMVMDFCGGDLWGFLSKSPSISEWQAATILRGVLSALELVHSRGVVHRDVKVENILMASNERPILADFGLAALKTDQEEMRRRCGSPGYVAPEVLDADCLDYDEKVDVFSVGVVFYFMLCRRTPFDGPDLATILRRTVRCKLDLEGLKETQALSSHCRRFLRWLLSRKPGDRPQAEEVLESSLFQQLCMLGKLSPREVVDADSTCSTLASMSDATAQSGSDRIPWNDNAMSDISVRPHRPPSRSKKFVRRARYGRLTGEQTDPALASMADDIATEMPLASMSIVQRPTANKPPCFRRPFPRTRSQYNGRNSPQILESGDESPHQTKVDNLAALCEEPFASIDELLVKGNKLDLERPRAPVSRFQPLRASPRPNRTLQAARRCASANPPCAER